ncbi:MAG: DegT/DnrJ/EryC1/StrS family aminotransferase, partial [Nitrospira sp.]|nr:DegT/DnrJ/EryC1/StrS family aminotransferase [Nitrospira sp.]
MDADLIERAITPKTKALLPVHLNGRVCEMDRDASDCRQVRAVWSRMRPRPSAQRTTVDAPGVRGLPAVLV